MTTQMTKKMTMAVTISFFDGNGFVTACSGNDKELSRIAMYM